MDTDTVRSASPGICLSKGQRVGLPTFSDHSARYLVMYLDHFRTSSESEVGSDSERIEDVTACCGYISLTDVFVQRLAQQSHVGCVLSR